MGWVTIVENLVEPKASTTEEWSGPYYQFLLERYPEGLASRKHTSYLNRALLSIEDYDVVLGAEDRVTLVFTPGLPAVVVTAIWTALASAVVSVALNYAFQKLFPAKTTASEEASIENPSAGSVYTVTVPTNSAKLGDPVPVIYGQVLATPDIAAFAYSFFYNNDQYVDLMFCLGQGRFQIHETYISSSPISQTTPGAVAQLVFDVFGHQKDFGVIGDYWESSGYRRFYEDVVTSVEVGGQQLDYAPGPGVPGAKVGPFMASGPGTVAGTIEVDFVWPNGLYYTDSSGLFVTLLTGLGIGITPVDDNGVPTGATVMYTQSIGGATNTPLRRTFSYPMAVPGRFSVFVEQYSESTGRSLDSQVVNWTSLKAMLRHTQEVYGDTTLVTMRLKATDEISTDAINRIGVKCTRNLPHGGLSSNPAHHMRDIITNTVYGAGRPLSEIDAAAEYALYVDNKGFNGIFDTKITVWNALEAVMQPSRASPVTNGALISLILDRPQTVYKYLFDKTNTVKDSVEYGWLFAQVDDIEGYEVEWRDLKDWVANYKTHPLGALNVESVTLMGCTDGAVAQAHANYLWRRNQYRRKTVKFKTELEGHLPQLNDLIRVMSEFGDPGENYLITAIDPVDEFTVQIEAVQYDSRIYV